MNNLGLLAAREGRTAEAIGYFQQALKLSPDHLIALDNLGSAYRQENNGMMRARHMSRLYGSIPMMPMQIMDWVWYSRKRMTPRGASDLLLQALKLRPGYPEALNNLGILYLRTQRRNQAVATFEECIRLAPAFEQAYLNLARVYAIEDTPDKARAVLMELLKQHPGDEQALKMLEQLGR